MATITSLTITYVGNNCWTYITNLQSVPAISSFYDGTCFENLVTLNTDNGGILINNVPYNVIEYVDTVEPENNHTPSSATDLIIYLKGKGFFDKDISGGSGTDILFTDLLDTFPNKFGRALQLLRVNADETLIESFEAVLAQYFTDLLDTPNEIGFANRNKFLAANSSGTAIVWTPNPFSNFTLPIPGFGVFNISKGYHWESGDIVINELEEFEIGDFCSVSLYVNESEPNEGVILIPHARYKGGNQLLKESYEYNYSEKIAFDTEPDSE